MRYLFCILLALSLVGDCWAGQIFRGSTTGGGGSYQTPSLVNSGSATAGGAVQTTLALPSKSTTTGNAIIIHVCWYNASRSVSSVTDTAGNTYVRAGTTYTNGDAGLDTWVAYNATGNASNVVTVTMSSTTSYLRATMEEVSGLASSSAFDKEATGTGASSSMTTSATATTSQTHEYLTSFFYTSAASSGTPGTNWTEIIDTGDDFYSQYRVVASTGAYSASATSSGGSGGYYAIIKTFKAAAN